MHMRLVANASGRLAITGMIVVFFWTATCGTNAAVPYMRHSARPLRVFGAVLGSRQPPRPADPACSCLGVRRAVPSAKLDPESRPTSTVVAGSWRHGAREAASLARPRAAESIFKVAAVGALGASNAGWHARRVPCAGEVRQRTSPCSSSRSRRLKFLATLREWCQAA